MKNRIKTTVTFTDAGESTGVTNGGQKGICSLPSRCGPQKMGSPVASR